MVSNETVECMQHSRMMCICMWWTFVHASFCQRTENRAGKKRVFASVCSEVMKGRGGGGHVNVPCTSSATCCYAAQMVVLHLCIHCWNGPQCLKVDTWVLLVRGMEKICCHTATLEQSMPHGMLSKTSSPTRCFQLAQIFSSMWSAGSEDMWICIPVSSQKQFQRWSACSEKKEKACQHASMTWIQNRHETRILPNSRARIWYISACRNVYFASAKTRIFRNTLFLRAR